MLDSAAIAALAGFAARALPEVLKAVNLHLDRRHELAMQAYALAFEKERGPGYTKDALAYSGAEMALQMDALREAWKDQTRTGIAWLDGLSISVRPGITYALAGLYIAAKTYLTLVEKPGGYGEIDVQVFTGVLSFWMLGRVWERGK